MKDALKAVEFAFLRLGQGRVEMPAKIYLYLDKYRGDFRAMPAYIEGGQTCSIKWVNVHPGNRFKGLPTVMATIILSDARNGCPLCIMDGTYITALRTGAAGAVAAKYLARKDSSSVALVGCGVQAEAQLLGLAEIFRIKEVKVWGRASKEARVFIRKFCSLLKAKMFAASTVQECLKDSDIVVTTTPSRKPLVKLAWLKEGVHINAMGADAKGKQELDPAILKKALVVVDSWEHARHSGEINVPLSKGQLTRQDIYADIGEVVMGKKGRRSNKEITVFDSTGLAIQDLAVAHIIYQKARRLRQGRYLRLI